MMEIVTTSSEYVSILRNGPSGSNTPKGPMSAKTESLPHPRSGGGQDCVRTTSRVSFDEEGLREAERIRMSQPRMKIDMPDTPFLYYDSRAEPAEQFKTAEPSDKVVQPGGEMQPVTFDADSLQRRLGLVKLLQEAEEAYKAETGGSVEKDEDIPVIEVKAGRSGFDSSMKQASELLDCHRRIVLRGAGPSGTAAATEMWRHLVTKGVGALHNVHTGLERGGRKQVSVVKITLGNPYVALEVDRTTGASIPRSEFDAKRRALYKNQAECFKEALARAAAEDDDED